MTSSILKVFLIDGTGENLNIDSYFRAKTRKEKIKKLYERSDKLV